MPRITREYIRHAAVEEGFQGVWKLWSRLNTRISISPPSSVQAINVIINFRASKGPDDCIYNLLPFASTVTKALKPTRRLRSHSSAGEVAVVGGFQLQDAKRRAETPPSQLPAGKPAFRTTWVEGLSYLSPQQTEKLFS